MEDLEIRDLTFTYPGGSRPALDGVSLNIRRGGFTALCGPSGGGKSTLLRLLKPAISPQGEISGAVLLDGRPLSGLGLREQTSLIGFVGQSPENQTVTDKVWHELAFGLESLGLENREIRARTAEMSAFFGITDWFYRDVSALSGGQKQILNLASVMAMQPEILLLDEPTSRLDPVASADFLAAVGRINRELGTAVIIAEHRLDDVLPMAGSAAVLEAGKLVCVGAPMEAGETLRREKPGIFLSMPAPMRIWSAVPSGLACPVTPAQGAVWLSDFSSEHALGAVPPAIDRDFSGEPALKMEGVWFRYERNSPDVLRSMDLSVYPGEILALMGGNGAGKSTALSAAAGLEKPYRGSVRSRGRAALLPQEPLSLFVRDKLRCDLDGCLKGADMTPEERSARTAEITALCGLQGLEDRDPRDMSGGEQQRAALAMVLLAAPDILLLDEPTKGVDAEFKLVFAGVLEKLAAGGTAVVMASHDAEFCAAHAHRCAMLFDGAITAEDTPREFFSKNFFYTTPASRMARALLPQAVTPEDVIAACGGRLEPPGGSRGGVPGGFDRLPAEKAAGQRGMTVKRLLSTVFAAAAVFFLVSVLKSMDFSDLLGDGGLNLSGVKNFWQYAGLALSLMGLALSAAGDGGEEPGRSRRKLSGGAAAVAAVCLLLIPLTVYAGFRWFGDRKYYFISILILTEVTAAFLATFEGRAPEARDISLVAVLCALAVAGRAAFFMLPSFKPVLAIVIISGAAFGGETGFLVGAASMLVSNIMFGQGPWTPWQMFAMGLAGFAAGALADAGLLGLRRLPLCVCGALTAVFLYGPIVNIASVLIWQGQVTPGMILAAFVTGLPFDLIHAAATVTFLWLGAEPMLRQLRRMKTKYGILA